jgi:hypothetical protein
MAERVEADGEGEPEAVEVREAADGPAERRGEGEEEYHGTAAASSTPPASGRDCGAASTGEGDTEAIGGDEAAGG